MAKLELFARERRDGWKCLGNEIDGSDIAVATIDHMRPSAEFLYFSLISVEIK